MSGCISGCCSIQNAPWVGLLASNRAWVVVLTSFLLEMRCVMLCTCEDSPYTTYAMEASLSL